MKHRPSALTIVWVALSGVVPSVGMARQEPQPAAEAQEEQQELAVGETAPAAPSAALSTAADPVPVVPTEREGAEPQAGESSATVSPAELRALRELSEEAEIFEQAAGQYQRFLDRVVQHHFEERRRRVIEGLEKEIEVEQEALELARAEAIRRFEEFIAKYQGPKADPEATPDAMYRLAALYEERARADFDGDLTQTLEPAAALYRRIISEYPGYREIAGVHYYLGHALMDQGALAQGQQVFRSLVCGNRYQVRTDPKSNGVLLQAMPQDRGDEFWEQWYAKNPIPLDQLSAGEQRRRRPMIGVREEELRFLDPYAECVALPQEVEEGEEPRYLAEVWWQLGNYHFDQLDSPGGPYALNRAASAYEHSMEYKKPPLYGVALYKRAWTHFKQQRYGAAVEWFTNLLHYADQQQEETGDPGVDFRTEAYVYIATSLTYVDLKGPPPEDPYIPRSDVLDLELNPLVAEQKMRIAIERVQDPELVPQDKPWSGEIYKALAQEFIDLSQYRNAIETLELALAKYPLDRDAPVTRNRVAELYDEIAQLAPAGSAAREEALAKALAARTQLATYVGDTEWVRANAEDPEALRQAERLVRNGLQRAAADHTNTARALAARAEELEDPGETQQLLEKSLGAYRLAALGWGAYIEQDPNAIDVYESRFWLADAHYWNILLQLKLGQSPAAAEVANAIAAAAIVRDSNEDDRYLQPAAYYVVSIADEVLAAKYREYEMSGGTSGIPRQSEVTFQGTGLGRQVVKKAVPKEVLDAIQARDDYNRRIALGDDPEKNGLMYAFQAADHFFVYGDFERARERFEPLRKEHCGRNEWGYKAWEKLLTMSAFEKDAAGSRALAQGESCAFDEATRAAEEAIRTPVISGVAYLDARNLYDEAQQMPPGEEREAKWREAASAYKVALDAAPDRDEAPEAAMNGAYAYKQVGEYDKAIEMYELFISNYGTEQKLTELKNGDPSQDPPVAANPEQYQERAKFLKMAYDALANAYVLFFDYSKASETFQRIASNQHFDAEQRRDAARQAIGLCASLNDDQSMQEARKSYLSLGPSAAEAAEADFLVASAKLKVWDPLSPDDGKNAQARAAAEKTMLAYYRANQDNPAAYPHVVEAAYWVAKAQAAEGSRGERAAWERTMEAFETYRKGAPVNADGTSSAVGSRYASMAAEGAYRILDGEIQKSVPMDSGRVRFRGTPQEVLTQYREAAKQAKSWFDRLQGVVDRYASPEWGTAAVARQGTLYDALRSALYNTRPPDLEMFDQRTEALLRRAEESDNLELQEKADALRVKVESAWQDVRDRELAGADQVLVDRYGRAIALARRYNVTHPAIVRAIQRLAFFTEVIGEAKLSSYASRVPELDYRAGMFLRIRPGLVTAPEPGELPPGSPNAAGAP